MKKLNLKTIGTTALVILILAAFSQFSVSAQGGDDEAKKAQQNQENDPTRPNDGRQLIGTWDVQVTLRNCQTGVAMRTFASVTTFMAGGTMMDSSSGIPQSLKTPGQGVWSQIEGNTYRFKIKSFNFDAAGVFTGWTIIKHDAHLNRRTDEVDSSGTAQVYAPNGVLVFSGCSTTTAIRFE